MEVSANEVNPVDNRTVGDPEGKNDSDLNSEEMDTMPQIVSEDSNAFKMPSLPGTPSATPKVCPDITEKPSETKPSVSEPSEVNGQDTVTHSEPKSTKSPAELAKANSVPLPYQEPSWGGIPDKKYYVEVLKNGTIVDTIYLKDKGYFVIGRLANCDILMEHPSLSRYHAVLQYKVNGSPEKPVGFYLFDLDSTHGTFHNKNKCFPKTFYRLRVGHMMKFGGSTRSLILQGPDEDIEDESDLSVTQLKSLSAEKARKREEEKVLKEKAEEAKEEEDSSGGGVSWGMGDDAEEFPDMEQNPFAETADNESLYINDPKKALKNWFDREGYDLEYEVEEKGYAQFLCKINLPVDSPTGGSTVAEALVKGKKKESTVQAALEACRILDRMGMLRPSQQTAVERKVKKWEEDDFYASDEDEFLDRTGSIEKKRKSRMKLAGMETDKVETYDSLVKRREESTKLLVELESELKEALARKEKSERRSESLDLDNYLVELKKGAQIDKETIQKLKIKIGSLNQELEQLSKLIDIAKPASMPKLEAPGSKAEKPKLAGVMIGKRGSKGLLGKVKSVSQGSKSAPVVSAVDTKVLEAFLNDSEDSSKTKSKLTKLDDDDEDEDELKPIGYEPKPETKPKDRIGDTSVNKSSRVLGPNVPESVLLDKINAAESKQIDPSIKDLSSDLPLVPDETIDEASPLKEKRKRGDRGSKRKRKVEDEVEEEEEYYKVGMDKKYDVWVPPADQTGDGRTSLNDKLGY